MNAPPLLTDIISVKSQITPKNWIAQILKQIKYKRLDATPKLNYIITHVPEVVTSAVIKLGGYIVTVDTVTWLYSNGYWTELDAHDVKVMLTKVNEKLKYIKLKTSHKMDMQLLLGEQVLNPFKMKSAGLNLKSNTFKFDSDKPKLISHTPTDGFKYKLDFDYKADAECPKFLQFLNQVLPDKDTQDLLSEYIASAFIPKLKLHKIAILLGDGRNGKSVFLEIITALFGDINVVHNELDNLTDKANRFSLVTLDSKIMNIFNEFTTIKDISLFKSLASKEPLQVERKNKDHYKMVNYATLLGACNTLPKKVERTTAYIERLIIIPFKVYIKPSERNPYLAQQIVKNELPGVLKWLIDAKIRLINNGKLTRSKLVDDAVEEHKRDTNTAHDFITQSNIEVLKDLLTPLREVHNKYIDFMKENYNGYAGFGTRQLAKELRKLGYKVGKKNGSIYVGVIIHSNNNNSEYDNISEAEAILKKQREKESNKVPF